MFVKVYPIENKSVSETVFIVMLKTGHNHCHDVSGRVNNKQTTQEHSAK